MSTTTAIKAAMTELDATIRTLARLPETDKAATAALLSSSTARAHLRDALEAATLAGTQADVDHLADTPSPATATPKHQTENKPFFSCGTSKDWLFSVRDGIPLADALEQASCFLESAQEIAYESGGAFGTKRDSAISGVAYLIEMAKAVVDATVRAIYIEEAAGAK